MDFFRNILNIPDDRKMKDTAARLLKMDKNAMEAFNASYNKCLEQEEESDNFFDVNSRQAAAAHEGISAGCPGIDGIIRRIVDELKENTQVWSFDGKNISVPVISEKCSNPVTNDEIKALPEELRPQLTGSLAKVDINQPSYLTLLWYYDKYLRESNPDKKQMFYHHFRQGLDILDLDNITYEIIGTNPNSMGHWLPEIVKPVLECGFFKIPKTTIVKVPLAMLQLTRNDYMGLTRTTLDIVDRFCYEVFGLKEDEEYFIKTGTYSSKFDFRNAYVHGAKEVRELGEYLLFIHFQACMMASPLSSPVIYGVSTTNEWVVREFIHDREDNPSIYKGFPLHTEYRAFVDFDTDEVLGIVPYWDSESMKKRFSGGLDAESPHMVHDYMIYCAYEEKLMKRFKENVSKVEEELIKVIPEINLSGQWSVDIMQNGDDFWIIDMALAANSALVNKIPQDKLKELKEDWIPKINE